jgi:Fe-S-cluster containining protein
MAGPPSEQGAWYAQGLHFSCTRCGACCTGEPGFTWLSVKEAERLAERLGLDLEAFQRRYLREVWRGGQRRLALTEKADHACVFWDRRRGCTVYSDRPRQCRTWPFWRSNLGSRDDWREAGRSCPGIGTGDHHDAASIAATAADDGLP